MKKLLAILFVIALSISVSGCATTGGVSTGGSEVATALGEMTIRYAVQKQLAGKAEKIENALEILKDVRAYATEMDDITIGMLQERAIEKIAWDGMDKADERLVKDMISLLSAEITTRVGKGPLDDTKLVVVLDYLDWVETTFKDLL